MKNILDKKAGKEYSSPKIEYGLYWQDVVLSSGEIGESIFDNTEETRDFLGV